LTEPSQYQNAPALAWLARHGRWTKSENPLSDQCTTEQAEQQPVGLLLITKPITLFQSQLATREWLRFRPVDRLWPPKTLSITKWLEARDQLAALIESMEEEALAHDLDSDQLWPPGRSQLTLMDRINALKHEVEQLCIELPELPD
jgi:hypothetical protein